MRTTSKFACIALTTGLAVGAIVGLAGPAGAATTGGTDATFAITSGSLAITVPTSPVALATVATGALSASGQLGPVTVDDTRGALSNGWTTTVTSTAFTTGTSTTNETVSVGNVAYSSGAFTAHSGAGTFVAGSLVTAPSYTGGAGNSSTTWNPTLTFTLAASQVAGTYSGTITHSVA
jgi:hypothetical protein